MGGLSLDRCILVHVVDLGFGVLTTSGDDQGFLARIIAESPRIRQGLVQVKKVATTMKRQTARNSITPTKLRRYSCGKLRFTIRRVPGLPLDRR